MPNNIAQKEEMPYFNLYWESLHFRAKERSYLFKVQAAIKDAWFAGAASTHKEFAKEIAEEIMDAVTSNAPLQDIINRVGDIARELEGK